MKNKSIQRLIKVSYKAFLILVTLNMFTNSSYANNPVDDQRFNSGNETEIRLQEEITVTGKVFDENNVPLLGVTVVIKGTTQGTVTNLDGEFTIQAPADATLLLTFIGYVEEEVALNGQTSIEVTLIPDLLSLEEVVVTALGMKRDKKALGYSMQEVDGEELKKTKEMDMVNSLSGKVAGVNITQGGGGLGGGGSRINSAIYVR